jgi:hypothetical protein
MNVDLRAFGVTSLLGSIAITSAGLLPAWFATRRTAAGAWTSRVHSEESPSARRLSRTGLVLEAGLACSLLVVGGLASLSFRNLGAVDRGLDTDGVIQASIAMHPRSFADQAARAAIARDVEERMRAVPGVEDVVLSRGLPPGGGTYRFGARWRSDLPDAPLIDMTVQSYDVSPAFFTFFRIPVIKGRPLLLSDDPSSVVIGERLAELFWPGLDPVGRSFYYQNSPFRVVGVAAELRYPSLDRSLDHPEFYRSFHAGGSVRARSGDFTLSVSLRCGGACPPVPVIRHQIREIGAGLSVSGVGPLVHAYEGQRNRPRTLAAAATTFSLVATVTAAAGVFGVLTYVIGRRRRELAIRTAMGAQPRDLRLLVVREALFVCAGGILTGLPIAWYCARVLESFWYGVTPGTPAVWIIAAGAVAVTTLLASWPPARYASRIDSARLLRDT